MHILLTYAGADPCGTVPHHYPSLTLTVQEREAAASGEHELTQVTAVSMTQSPPPGNATGKDQLKSPNFQFLAGHHTLLVHLAALAERYLFDDPSTALFKLRQFAELLARQACANVGIATSPVDDQPTVLNLLRDRPVAAVDTLDLFHALRKTGNAAVHEIKGTQSDALHHLRMARQLAMSRSTAGCSTTSTP